jgi:hypothetical protein
MDSEKYGEEYREHLLEQYKLYVQIMDNTSVQRGNINKFYISVLAFLLTLISIFINNNFSNLIIFIVSLMGLLLCFTWYKNIESFRQLNSGRFQVIHEMEKELPFNCFDKEWGYLKKGNGENYTRLTKIEKYVPLYLSIPYVFILLYYIVEFFLFLKG